MPRGGQGVEESSLLSRHPNLHAPQSHSPGRTLKTWSRSLLLHTPGRQHHAVEREQCVSLDTEPPFPHMRNRANDPSVRSFHGLHGVMHIKGSICCGCFRRHCPSSGLRCQDWALHLRYYSYLSSIGIFSSSWPAPPGSLALPHPPSSTSPHPAGLTRSIPPS